MRFINFLIEAEEQIGVIVSTHNGRFYDIDFVDWDTQRPLAGHLRNIGASFVSHINNEHDNWDDVVDFFQENYSGQSLGGDYSAEDAEFVMYGPLSANEMNMLQDTFDELYGHAS